MGQRGVALTGASVLVRIVEMASETVATVDRAGARGHQQRTSVVFMQYAIAECAGVIADRVHRETGHVSVFCLHRQNLTQQRVVYIAGAHARDIAARHP